MYLGLRIIFKNKAMITTLFYLTLDLTFEFEN
jgi:hypothetical protein